MVGTTTVEARKTFNARFSSPEEKSQYFAELARKRRGSIVLSPAEQAALSEAYGLLRKIAARVKVEAVDDDAA